MTARNMTSGGVESSIAASTLYTRSASYAHCSDLCLEPNDIFAPEWRRSLILRLRRRGACLSLHAFSLHVQRSIGVKFQKVRNLHICDLRLYGTVAAFVLITCGTQTDGGRRTSRASMGVVVNLEFQLPSFRGLSGQLLKLESKSVVHWDPDLAYRTEEACRHVEKDLVSCQ